MNSDLVLRVVPDALTKYDICFDQLSLILSNATRYMIKAGIEIRKRAINCFHVTCNFDYTYFQFLLKLMI